MIRREVAQVSVHSSPLLAISFNAASVAFGDGRNVGFTAPVEVSTVQISNGRVSDSTTSVQRQAGGIGARIASTEGTRRACFRLGKGFQSSRPARVLAA